MIDDWTKKLTLKKSKLMNKFTTLFLGLVFLIFLANISNAEVVNK